MRARSPGRIRIIGLVTASLLLAVVGACTSAPAETHGPHGPNGPSGPAVPSGTGSPSDRGSTSRTGSPHRSISEEMPPLPVDPHAAMVEVRRLLAEQMVPLLADSGQRWREVRFLLTTSETDETAYQGFLFVTVSGTAGRLADGMDPPERMGTAARARGWDDGGISYLLNVIRGPYHLRSTVRPGGEYRYELSTPSLNPPTLIEGTGDLSDEIDRTDGVPELEAYRESS